MLHDDSTTCVQQNVKIHHMLHTPWLKHLLSILALKRHQTTGVTRRQCKCSQLISTDWKKKIKNSSGCRASTLPRMNSDNNSIPDYADISINAYWSPVPVDLLSPCSLPAIRPPPHSALLLWIRWIIFLSDSIFSRRWSYLFTHVHMKDSGDFGHLCAFHVSLHDPHLVTTHTHSHTHTCTYTPKHCEQEATWHTEVLM